MESLVSSKCPRKRVNSSLGVAPVVAQSDFRARGERRVVADFSLLDDTIQSGN